MSVITSLFWKEEIPAQTTVLEVLADDAGVLRGMLFGEVVGGRQGDVLTDLFVVSVAFLVLGMTPGVGPLPFPSAPANAGFALGQRVGIELVRARLATLTDRERRVASPAFTA
jgi:hypothetical protein